jgi:hypothetical protein
MRLPRTFGPSLLPGGARYGQLPRSTSAPPDAGLSLSSDGADKLQHFWVAPQASDAARPDGSDAAGGMSSVTLIAAEVMIAAPDFGNLEPMLHATQQELRAAGVTEVPQVLLVDAGYWHQQQMEHVVDYGIQVLVPLDANSRKGPAQAGTAYQSPALTAGEPMNGVRSPSLRFRTKRSASRCI